VTAYQLVAVLQQQMNTGLAHDATSSGDTGRASPAPPPAPRSEVGGETMTNADVIELRAAGLDDDNLIATIKSANGTKFDLSPAGLRALLEARVSNRVITAMRERK
jgi:hypothetical protein